MARAGRAVLTAGASVAAALACAPPAAADSILYRCFPNVCRVAPDGSGRAAVTRDGARGGPAYAWLSATADGSRLGVSYGNRAYVLDGTGRRLAGPLPHSGGAVLATQISPDGGQVATIETVGEIRPPSPGPPVPTPFLFVAAADGTARDTVARDTAATAWLGGRLLRDTSARSTPFEQQLCLLASNTDFPCERLVAAEPGRDLWDPAVSPDGSLVAATRAPVDGTRGEIALYSTATAQLVRVVTSGPGDSQPSWSPDGRSLAFTRGDGGLWVTGATGEPGSERRIAASGSQPVWVRGGPLRLTGPRRARTGRRVRIVLTGAPRGARTTLERRTGRRWTTVATRRAGASRTTFTARFRRPGRVRLRARIGAGVSTTLTVTVVRGRAAR